MQLVEDDAQPVEDVAQLDLDYQMTAEVFRTLADIRFRLLALVPAVAGAALALLDAADPETQLGVGLLGLSATLGILIYELRNSQMYNWAVHRARYVERRLGLTRSALGRPGAAGVFGERPAATYRLAGLVTIKHDRGLALVYGAAMAGWVYLIARSGLELATSTSGRADFWIALGAAALAGVSVAGLINRHDRNQVTAVAVDNPTAVAQQLSRARQDVLAAGAHSKALGPSVVAALALCEQVDALGFDDESMVAAALAALRQALLGIAAEAPPL